MPSKFISYVELFSLKNYIIIVSDFVWNYLKLKKRGKLVMGYSDTEFSQMGGYDLIHPDDLKYYANAHKECLYCNHNFKYVVFF